MMRKAFRVALLGLGYWLFMVLWHTPRGDEWLEKLARVVFPEWTRRRSTDPGGK
jgi:hypothetical protein